MGIRAVDEIEGIYDVMPDQHFHKFSGKKKENRQFGVQNEWRVVQHDVTDSVNFANRTDAHERQ